MTLNSDPATGEIIEMAPQDFIQVMRALNFGDVAERLSTDYNALLRDVMRLGKVGSITFKLTLKPTNKGGVTQMELYPMISVNAPKEEMGADMMYLGDRGLQREHPRQKEIEGMRAVERDNKGSLRTAISDVEVLPVRTAT